MTGGRNVFSGKHRRLRDSCGCCGSMDLAGWRRAPLQSRISQTDFGSRYLFSQGVFYHGANAIETRLCRVTLEQGQGTTFRLAGRCHGVNANRQCRAGLELHVTLQEDWEGRRRLVGWGREVVCMCHQAADACGGRGQPGVGEAAPPCIGCERRWKVEEYEARRVDGHVSRGGGIMLGAWPMAEQREGVAVVNPYDEDERPFVMPSAGSA